VGDVIDLRDYPHLSMRTGVYGLVFDVGREFEGWPRHLLTELAMANRLAEKFADLMLEQLLFGS
jgi:hypothetical protein